MSKNCVTHHYACDCREAEFAALRAEVEELRKRVKELDRSYCAYCNETLDRTWEAIQQHMEACDRHPMASLRAEVERLKELETHYDQIALERGQWAARCEDLGREVERWKEGYQEVARASGYTEQGAATFDVPSAVLVARVDSQRRGLARQEAEVKRQRERVDEVGDIWAGFAKETHDLLDEAGEKEREAKERACDHPPGCTFCNWCGWREEEEVPDPVLAERERCARIAETYPFAPDTHTGTRQLAMRNGIAEQIRSGREP